MRPTIPVSPSDQLEPNFELLRRAGWSVNNFSGPYCVVFRGQDEAVFEWVDGGWQRVTGCGPDWV